MCYLSIGCRVMFFRYLIFLSLRQVNQPGLRLKRLQKNFFTPSNKCHCTADSLINLPIPRDRNLELRRFPHEWQFD